MIRTLTLYVLFGLLLPLTAAAQYAERAVGGPACYRVLTHEGAILSQHTRQTKAQIAVAQAQEATSKRHGYVDGCFYSVDTPGVSDWPDVQPGQVLLSAQVALHRGPLTGQVWDAADLQWSPDGSEWFPLMRLTTGTATLLDALAADSIRLRLVAPGVEGAP